MMTMLRRPTLLLLLAMAIPQLLAAQSVASVGGVRFTRQQLERRIAIERAYGGKIAPEAALVFIINDALEREVARSLGLLPDAVQLRGFSDHADATSKAPEILAAIKGIFGADTAGYRWSYLAPRLINMSLHHHFVRDTILHASERQSIQQAYTLVAAGAGFSDAAARTGLTYRLDSVVDRRGPLLPELAPYAGADSVASDPYHDLIRQLAPGQLAGSIIETNVDYRVLRLISRSDSLQLVEVISAGKGDFDTWFRSEAKKIRISINDKKLRRAIAEKYSGLWWKPDR